jgi:hypothetical protein
MINMTNRELFLLGFNPKLTKSDLTKKDDMFYVGHIVDVDSDGYVDEETAQLILTDYNRSI